MSNSSKSVNVKRKLTTHLATYCLIVLSLISFLTIYLPCKLGTDCFTGKLSELIYPAVPLVLAFLSFLLINNIQRSKEAFHSQTHAALCLLVIMGIAVTVGIAYFFDENTARYPFILVAFILGTIGAGIGIFQRLHMKDPENELRLQRIHGQAASYSLEGHSELHLSIINQVYLSITIGGLFGVIGYTMSSAISEMAPYLPQYFSATTTGGAKFKDWLSQTPMSVTEYSQVMIICLLFGYSERLLKSVLNKLEETVEQISTDLPNLSSKT